MIVIKRYWMRQWISLIAAAAGPNKITTTTSDRRRRWCVASLPLPLSCSPHRHRSPVISARWLTRDPSVHSFIRSVCRGGSGVERSRGGSRRCVIVTWSIKSASQLVPRLSCRSGSASEIVRVDCVPQRVSFSPPGDFFAF